MNKINEHIIIIGNGISGITAAREVRKQGGQAITVISAETDYFFSRTALMYVYMGHMKFEHTQPYENFFWQKNNIQLIKALVQKVDTASKKIQLDRGDWLAYDKLVIATGSRPNKFGWPGQDLKGVMGMYSKQDLEYLEQSTKNCKRAVIVGGGLIGIEMAEMLHSRKIAVTLLVREAGFWGNILPPSESAMIGRHIKEHHIDLRLSTGLIEILSDRDGSARAVVTDKGETIDCQVVGLAAGVTPNIDFLKGSGIELGKGVKVNRYLETNIENVYAIGDCAEQQEAIDLRKPVEAVWYTGRIMGETLARTLCGKRTAYDPGPWFNSAKFFDIEYQTYGWVWAKPREYENQFYWEHPKGKKAIRISYHKETKAFLGINCLGIRMRHEFFDTVLNNQLSVDNVISNLKKANFDPELFTTYEKEIKTAFEKDHSNLIPTNNG
ncbi:MAG: NAD(P)/FAD-dependent oxidoreductase [Ferruginibacter sp.]|nr:NAD(P)/FAD-dependent oxidoreductase [Ferruginibacter sp.]